MSTPPGPHDRPVPDDAAPDQSAADAAPATLGARADGVDRGLGVERHGMFGTTTSGDTSGFGGLVREPWNPPGTLAPYGSYFDDLVAALIAAEPAARAAIEKVVVDRDELTLHLKPDTLLEVATALRNGRALRFEMLMSVSGVDYLGATDRLHAVYHLMSMTFRRRLRLEVAVPVEHPHVPSLTSIYPTADWHERETYDMFGIVFDGHPALTRILMPDDWDGHPQRKDYPLGGIPVQYKGATIPPPDQRRVYR